MDTTLLLNLIHFEIKKRDDKIASLECMFNEAKYFSQNGEDGITLTIFNRIGLTNRFYVEFGTESGMECNTRILREKGICHGLLMDGSNENPKINLYKEFITAENIVDLFNKYEVPMTFDLLSVDVDFNDWYITKAILEAQYRPRVVIVEYNGTHPVDQDKIVVYNPTQMWDHTNYAGGSLLAFFRLFRKFGYSLIYCERKGVNAFFVLDDYVKLLENTFPFINNIEKIYRPASYSGSSVGDPQNRPLVSSSDFL